MQYVIRVYNTCFLCQPGQGDVAPAVTSDPNKAIRWEKERVAREYAADLYEKGRISEWNVVPVINS